MMSVLLSPVIIPCMPSSELCCWECVCGPYLVQDFVLLEVVDKDLCGTHGSNSVTSKDWQQDVGWDGLVLLVFRTWLFFSRWAGTKKKVKKVAALKFAVWSNHSPQCMLHFPMHLIDLTPRNPTQLFPSRHRSRNGEWQPSHAFLFHPRNTWRYRPPSVGHQSWKEWINMIANHMVMEFVKRTTSIESVLNSPGNSSSSSSTCLLCLSFFSS